MNGEPRTQNVHDAVEPAPALRVKDTQVYTPQRVIIVTTAAGGTDSGCTTTTKC